MQIAILLYDGVTALDAVGPFEVLWGMPGAEVRFVAVEAGPKRANGGSLSLVADYSLSDWPAPEMILIPGTPHPELLLHNEPVLAWIRQAHAATKWTTSVCTGALALGAAGILQGVRATTHWLALDFLAGFGAEPVKERVVRDGKIITGAGVSAGIDMALTLAALEGGEEVAQEIQLGLEYDPQPPFKAGSPDKAPAAIVKRLRGSG